MEMHNRDYCYAISYWKEISNKKAYIFCHLKANPQPPILFGVYV